jgi:hypothetical protein
MKTISSVSVTIPDSEVNIKHLSLNHKTHKDLNISKDCIQVEIQQNKDQKRRGRRQSMQEQTSRTGSPPRKIPRYRTQKVNAQTTVKRYFTWQW